MRASDLKEDVAFMALAWDGARGVSAELKRRRNALECPDQSRGDDVTPGTSPCWGQGLVDENDFCDICKANRLANQEYRLSKLKERSLAAKLRRRIHRLRLELIGPVSA